MFDALADRLESAWKKLRGQDKISESNIQDALREVRRALLEADVNLQVVKDFISEVEAKAQGAEVVKGVRPDQQFSKIVYDELVQVMGEENVPLAEAEQSPTIVLMAGLQGTGKTTAVRALADLLPSIKVVKGCPFNCDPDDEESACDTCRSDNAEIEEKKMKVVELPLGSTEDRVVGSINIEKALKEGTRALEPGILAEGF